MPLPRVTALGLLFGLLTGCSGDTSAPGQPVSPSASSVSLAAAVSSRASNAAEAPQPDWSALPGALLTLHMDSTVGVLFDDVPEADREALALALAAKPDSFWLERAARQVRLTSLRLSFRNAFYPKGTKWQLPLPPPTQWELTLTGRPERRSIGGHDVLAVDYAFDGTLLTDSESPGVSEPALRDEGGTWDEPFTFPVDPEFVFQRTGFACMDEGQFPPNSVDAEEVDLFYDDGCRVEANLSNTGCHQTALPSRSCRQALADEIGSVTTAMRFTHVPWDAGLAARVRLGTVTNAWGADLEPDAEEFRQHRFTYRYIPATSCTLVEQCVGGSGWRKLLMFPTADLNAGAKALEIGHVDYFHRTGGTVLSQHGVFEYSACHNHYHFTHYGEFSLGDEGDGIARKNGFCMQPTARLWNNELSPIQHPYIDCLEQGVAPGWIDEYKMGLECQWMDVTGVRTGKAMALTFETNPDGLLCEGLPRLDDQGRTLFEPTDFKTSTGEPVDRPVCDYYPAWQANNTESYDVTLPENGDGYVTQPCREGLFGELRNCGLRNRKILSECTPGQTVRLHCTAPAGSPTQVVRVCEGSRGLGTGIPCTYNEALASAAVDGEAELTFTCPLSRDATETGGAYSWLIGALLPWESAVALTCEVRG